jgi:regulator of cell morphogenesis and NO signaling
MNITKDMKMADVILHNYQLLPVISRFGIRMGFGEKTVQEVCLEYDFNSDFFVEITNSFIDDEYIPQTDLKSFPVSLIVYYLHKTHEYYLEEKVPEIESMINEMVKCSEGDKNKRKLVGDFFLEYKKELTNHILREEEKVQPYVLEIESAFNNNSLPADLFKKIKKYSIEDFASEHDNVVEKLNDLKNIIIKYLPPCTNMSLSNKILIELFRLEKDLNAHARLEDKVLIPKVFRMEQILLDLYKSA